MSCKQRTDLLAYIKELEAAGKYEESLEYARKEPVGFSRLVVMGIDYYSMGDVEAGMAAKKELGLTL